MSKDGFKELDKVKDIVIQKLRDVPATRDSDTLLYCSILKEYFQHMEHKCDEEDFLSDLNELIRFAPNKSSISRVKRKIQNEERIFEPTKKVRLFRKARQSDFKEWSMS
tara:strand:+ start:553 stop:879 length:327 start_codon:yes stop_codon:yes gene_type:complete